LHLAKRAVLDADGLAFDIALPMLEDMYRYELMPMADAEEGLRAFTEKRRPVWRDC
jgi:cyclohexa-1,5-dienecarbonyl-CoA hydratase